MNEKQFAIICGAFGILVATLLSPMDQLFSESVLFWGNLLAFWGPHLLILVLALALCLRGAYIAGILFALALYLSLYGIWVFFYASPNDSLIWLGYWFSMPGAVIGEILLAIFVNKKRTYSAWVAWLIALTVISICIAMNQFILCKTLLHCGI